MRNIPKILAVCLFALAVSYTGSAQDVTEPGPDAGIEAGAESGVDSAVPTETGDDGDAADTDPGSYLDIDEDDFRPSEEIPADQSIDFPTDI